MSLIAQRIERLRQRFEDLLTVWTRWKKRDLQIRQKRVREINRDESK